MSKNVIIAFIQLEESGTLVIVLKAHMVVWRLATSLYVAGIHVYSFRCQVIFQIIFIWVVLKVLARFEIRSQIFVALGRKGLIFNILYRNYLRIIYFLHRHFRLLSNVLLLFMDLLIYSAFSSRLVIYIVKIFNINSKLWLLNFFFVSDLTHELFILVVFHVVVDGLYSRLRVHVHTQSRLITTLFLSW